MSFKDNLARLCGGHRRIKALQDCWTKCPWRNLANVFLANNIHPTVAGLKQAGISPTIAISCNSYRHTVQSICCWLCVCSWSHGPQKFPSSWVNNFYYGQLPSCKRAYGLGSQCRPNECLFGSGKTPGGWDSGWGGPDGQMREIQGSVYEQPKEEVDGSCHSKEGSN
jgi:hypothetical protein